MVDESPWPLIGSVGAFFLTCGLVKWFHTNSCSLLLIGMAIIIRVIAQWWADVSCEGTIQGLHSKLVEVGLRYGILLFIASEVLFFASFFWAFFHRSLAPSVEVGSFWPPAGIIPFNPLEVPLLNTLVLLSSGATVTWAHHAMMSGDLSKANTGLLITVILGAYFTCLQALEYYEASFSICDRAYGSTFFLATGFHGLHVLVGTSFLVVCFLRANSQHFRPKHHFGFEAAAWYWHFVDVVWLFLYVSIYWWGNLCKFSIIITFHLLWKDFLT